MAWLFVNVASKGEYPAREVAERTFAQGVRFVALPDFDARPYVAELRSLGLSTLLCLARESFPDGDIRGGMRRYYERHGDSVFYEDGNEPDWESNSSWTMTQAEYTELLWAARQAMPSAYLIAGGLVSGQPDWLAGVDLSPVNAVGVHPYAKQAYSAELDYMLAGYAAYGKPLWATEYHARARGMAACLRDDPRVQCAAAFCYTDGMVPGFGMLEDPAALEDFASAARTAERPPTPTPEEQMAEFQYSIKAEADRLASLGVNVGEPLEDEQPLHAVPGGEETHALQQSEHGLFVYSKASDRVQFYRAEGT